MTPETREVIDRLDAMSNSALETLFHQLDHAGRTESVGDDHEYVEQCLEDEGYTVVDIRPDAMATLCVAHRGTEVVLACDLYGPWAARVQLRDLDDAPDDVDSWTDFDDPLVVPLDQLVA